MAFQLIFKRYAPFNYFGGGFHGDGRTTASLVGSARTWGIVDFDIDKGVIKYSARSDPSWHKLAPSIKRTGVPKIVLSKEKLSPNRLVFTAHTAGALPIPGAPPIDTFVDFDIDSSTGTIVAKGVLRGDNFPNAEVFIKSMKSNKSILLFHFKTDGDKETGPVTRLFGTHASLKFGTFSKKVSL